MPTDPLDRLHDMRMSADDQPGTLLRQPPRQRTRIGPRKMPELEIPMRHGAEQIDRSAPARASRRCPPTIVTRPANPAAASVAPLREGQKSDAQWPASTGSHQPSGHRSDRPDPAFGERRHCLIETPDALVEHMIVGERHNQLRGVDPRCIEHPVEKCRCHRMAEAQPRRSRKSRPLDDGAFAIGNDQIGPGNDFSQRRVDLGRFRGLPPQRCRQGKPAARTAWLPAIAAPSDRTSRHCPPATASAGAAATTVCRSSGKFDTRRPEPFRFGLASALAPDTLLSASRPGRLLPPN